MELIDVFSSQNSIEEKITKQTLDHRLEQSIKNKVITGEQWFRKPDIWYSITSYSNPFKTPYTELKILIQNNKELKSMLKDSTKIFYGIGIADSETIIVDWDLEDSKYSEVCAIDVAIKFIEGFIQSLRNLHYEHESSKILFKGINDLFENISKNDISISNSRYNRSTHICLGNTVGNFRDQKEIMQLFQGIIKKDDLLVVGLQLNINPEKILAQYKGNKKIEELIQSSIDEKIKLMELEWKYNSELDTVEAWSDDLLIFHSKKYNLGNFIKSCSGFSFKHLKSFVNGDVAVVIFKKL